LIFQEGERPIVLISGFMTKIVKKATKKVRYEIKLYEIRKKDIVFSLIMIFLIGFILGTHLSPYFKTKTIEKVCEANITERGIEMLVPAVDSEGNGVLAKLITRVRPGSGLVLVNVNYALANYDTQISGRTAAKTAADYTNLSLINYDVIYTIIVNASVVEGPSAGAAMAISIVSAIQNKTPSSDVMITGTINDDGSIGEAGGILEKARAAKEMNITTFLVPLNQSKELTTGKTKYCRTINSIEYCEVTYGQEMVDIQKELNMTIKEVRNIGEAVRYFLGE
jgi:predicted S18 family serine protease